MNEEQLYDLISRMTIKEKVLSSDESVSWHAHREAEKITDESLFPVLMKIVDDNRQKKNKDIRNAAYFIIGVMLRNSFNKEACSFLIQQLRTETDKYVIESILDRLAAVSIPEEIDISLIIECSKNDKWQIRQSALNALGSSSTKESKEALSYYLNQEDEKKYEYEIVYSNASLGKIGTKKDIPLLQKHASSRKRDIRESAKFAIDSINNREQ